MRLNDGEEKRREATGSTGEELELVEEIRELDDEPLEEDGLEETTDAAALSREQMRCE